MMAKKTVTSVTIVCGSVVALLFRWSWTTNLLRS